MRPSTLGNPTSIGMRPEHELLLCCSRTCLDANTATRVQDLVKTDIDWTYLNQIALSHGVMPLLYQSLNKACAALVPKDVLSRLKDKFYANSAYNLAWSSQLLEILNLLESHDIRAIPFKGPVLAVSAYSDLTQRQFTDLDIFIHKQDALKVKDLLLSRGYQRVSSPPLTNVQEIMYLRAACEYRFISQDGNFAIEPHWDFAQKKYSINIDIESFWHHLDEISLTGSKITTFSPENSLLIACINGAKDRWKNLKTVCDVAELIRSHPRLNWIEFIKQLESSGCKRIVLLGIILAKDLLGIDPPNLLKEHIDEDIVVKQLALQVQKQIFSGAAQSPKDFGSNFSMWDLQIRERMGDRVLYCLNLVFGPNEGDAKLFPLPDTLVWAYPLLRPLRLLVRGLTVFIR